jgi:hypothetical protein
MEVGGGGRGMGIGGKVNELTHVQRRLRGTTRKSHAILNEFSRDRVSYKRSERGVAVKAG